MAFGWAIWSALSTYLPDVKIVIGSAVLVGLLVVVGYLRRTKCPRCSGSLSRIASRYMKSGAAEITTTCPHCGVSFDEPMDGPSLEPSLDAMVTIRKCVERRAEKISPVVYVAVAAFLYWFATPSSTVSGKAAISICVSLVVGGALFISRTKCPKCNRPLGLVANRVGSGGSVGTAKCPGCGVTVDEPIESTPTKD